MAEENKSVIEEVLETQDEVPIADPVEDRSAEILAKLDAIERRLDKVEAVSASGATVTPEPAKDEEPVEEKKDFKAFFTPRELHPKKAE